MANNKARSIYLDLSEKTLEKYEQESNKSGLITRLLEEHYDANIVKVKIDSKIKDAYDNDIFKEFRIPMLLLEFYMRGNIEESKKEISISSNNTNINEEVISATSSEKLNLKKQINNSKDVIKEDNNKDVIKEDNNKDVIKEDNNKDVIKEDNNKDVIKEDNT
ncbi:hypothetical protein HYI08_12850, partial [Clostridium botulinum]